MIKFDLVHSLYLILTYLFFTFILEKKFHIKKRYYGGNPKLKPFKIAAVPIIYMIITSSLSTVVPSAYFDGYISFPLLGVFIYFITPNY